MKRVNQVKKYPSTAPGVQEKVCERVNYHYDGYLGMTQNGVGRLAAVTYGSTDSACAMPGAFEEWYSYTQGGAVTNKTLRLTQEVFGVGPKSALLSSTQEYNSEGQMTKQYYPTVWAGSPATMQPTPTYQFVYDSMARLYQIKETSPQQNYYHVAEVNYGVASEIGNIKYNNWSQTQTRQYNVRLQMTRITAPGMDIEYLYSATNNNGQITGMKQWNGGSLVQQVAYTYDSLARLSNAQTTGGSVSWNLTFGMDGFGNLNSQTGAGPNWNQYTNPVNNRISSFTYDSNGNTTATAGPSSTVYAYDVENRLLQTTMPNGGGVERYGYGVGNQRVWRQKANGQYEYYFYKLSGERFGKYSVANLGQGNSDIGFFLLEQESVVPKGMQMNRDRLGNVMQSATTVYYPYGEEYTVTANDKDKFGTYHRDSTMGLDYAVNRYYSTQSARFLTADPYRASGGPKDPGSWNRYAYVGGDPINFGDPSGKARLHTLCLSLTVTDVEGFPHRSFHCETTVEWDKPLLQEPNPEGLPDPEMVKASMELKAEVFNLGIQSALNALQAKQTCRDLFAGSALVGMYANGDPGRFLQTWANSGLITFSSAHPDAGGLKSFANDRVGAVTVHGVASLPSPSGNNRVSVPSVVINEHGFFFTGGWLRNSNGSSTHVSTIANSGFEGLTGEQVQAAVVLHEMLHVAGVFGPDTGPNAPAGQSQRNSETVRKNCF